MTYCFIRFVHIGGGTKLKVMSDIVIRLQQFMENETRSCSMDFGCVTPVYVYRMWGGTIELNDIETAMVELKKHFFSA